MKKVIFWNNNDIEYSVRLNSKEWEQLKQKSKKEIAEIYDINETFNKITYGTKYHTEDKILF